MPKDLAIVLNNGSLNSAVISALASQKYRPIMIYGDVSGNPSSRIRAAYDQQVGHFKPYREHTLSMSYLTALQPAGNSAAMLSDPRQGGLLASQLLNLLPLMAAAAPFASHYEAAAIYVGLRVGPGADDLAQATEFVQIFTELVQLPCGQAEVEVVAPLLELEPWQVIDVGYQVNAPFDKGWSCTEETAAPCGSCRSCRAREAAFQQAAKPDPLGARK